MENLKKEDLFDPSIFNNGYNTSNKDISSDSETKEYTIIYKNLYKYNKYKKFKSLPIYFSTNFKQSLNLEQMNMLNTEEQFKDIMKECRSLFEKKLHDYGASWRILRPSSLTDQLFIKAKRIRSLEITGSSLVGEGIRPEFIALINYGIIGLIQLERNFVDSVDMDATEALALYDVHAKESYELMLKKNHDYGEAWRDMRVSSYTDLILTKIERVKEIENINGNTLVSEGIDANYMDIINYAVFGAIKLKEQQD